MTFARCVTGLSKQSANCITSQGVGLSHFRLKLLHFFCCNFVYLYNNWQSVYYSVSKLLLDAASYHGEIWHTDAWRPCPGLLLVFMSIGVVVTKIMTFFYNCGHVRLDACCGDVTSGSGSDGRSVGRTQYRPTTTGWLAQWTGWPLRVGRWSQQAGAALCCVSI